MRKFVAIAFVVAFFFSYVLLGSGRGSQSIAEALGAATLFTFIGWLVARKGGYRWAAASMAVIASLAWIGR